jgi:hypothetical protein
MDEETIAVKNPNYPYASGNRLMVLEKVKYLSKIEYEKRVGDNIWLAAWFDGNVKADAKIFFEYEELADEFVTVTKEIRELAMNGRRKSITFIGDKSCTTVSDVPTFHLSVPTPQSLAAPVIIVDVIEAVKKKPKQPEESKTSSRKDSWKRDN